MREPWLLPYDADSPASRPHPAPLLSPAATQMWHLPPKGTGLTLMTPSSMTALKLRHDRGKDWVSTGGSWAPAKASMRSSAAAETPSRTPHPAGHSHILQLAYMSQAPSLTAGSGCCPARRERRAQCPAPWSARRARQPACAPAIASERAGCGSMVHAEKQAVNINKQRGKRAAAGGGAVMRLEQRRLGRTQPLAYWPPAGQPCTQPPDVAPYLAVRLVLRAPGPHHKGIVHRHAHDDLGQEHDRHALRPGPAAGSKAGTCGQLTTSACPAAFSALSPPRQLP